MMIQLPNSGSHASNSGNHTSNSGNHVSNSGNHASNSGIHVPNPHYDLVVVGGGMVGASFACGLARAGADRALSILVVEAVDQQHAGDSQPGFDARSTALSYGSSRIFKSLGLWRQLQPIATAIKDIHVSDKGRFGSTHLNHAEQQVDALGYVVENAPLGRILNAEMSASDRTALLCPASISKVEALPTGMKLTIDAGGSGYEVTTALVVLADGGKSPVCSQLGIDRQVRDYGQHAVIANVAFEFPHRNVAYERFTDTGPLAVLPLASLDDEHRGSLVWTVTPEQSAELTAMDDETLLARLQERFGHRLGRFTRIGKKFCYPLTLSVAREQIRPGLVLLGNVAHTLHPVAGQGLNLALRDIDVLITTLLAAQRNGQALGEMAVLQRYLQRRDFDQRKAIAFTDYLTRLFSSNTQARVWARKFGLLSIDLLPPLRRGLAERAMGMK